MIDLSGVHLKIVQDILIKHVPKFEVRVFGSRQNNKTKPYSDLDLAIVGAKPAGKEVLEKLKDDFALSDLPFRVDVLDYNDTGEEFKKVINKGYDVLQKPG